MSHHSPASKHLRIATKRALAVESYLNQKSSRKQAARSAGVSGVTLWRWCRAYKAKGIKGLVPQFHNSGRRSALDSVRLTPKAISDLEKLVVGSGNLQRAWLQFTKRPHCPPAIATLGLRSMPAPLVRLIQLKPLQVRCYVSAATGTVYFKFPKGGRG